MGVLDGLHSETNGGELRGRVPPAGPVHLFEVLYIWERAGPVRKGQHHRFVRLCADARAMVESSRRNVSANNNRFLKTSSDFRTEAIGCKGTYLLFTATP